MNAIIFLAFATITFGYVVHGNPLPSASNNQTCNRKQIIRDLCSNTKRDMKALCRMVRRKMIQGRSKRLPTAKSVSSNFSTVKKLGKEKIIERLYFFHNILGDGYGFFGKNRSNTIMKTKTINIVIQIKALAEILQNNTDCNPGIPGNQFKFDLPKDKQMSGNSSGFLYRFAALLKQMQLQFETHVVQYINDYVQ